MKKGTTFNSQELDKLQDLINKAVAQGDTETAQTLLALLEKNKHKNNIKKA